jgi:hypothetical protein
LSRTAPTTRRCYIHVGLPKTGTSFLQSVLRQAEETLTEQGLDLLPRTWIGRRYLTVALRGRLDPETDPPAAFRVLDRLAKEAEKAPGERALISREVLGALTPDQIPPLLDALPGYEVHVVVTVRDLARTLPSGWQQETQALSSTSLDAFVAEFADGSEAAVNKHRRRVLQSVLDSWEHHVPPERIHVVTVPPSSAGPRVLLERFCAVLGVDASTIELGTPRENTALGVAQAELLRRVNGALGDRLSHPRGDYEQQAKQFLAKEVMRPQGGRSPRLPESARDWCIAASEAVIERLTTGGYDVVGDLEELRPAPGSFAGPDEMVTEEELLSTAVDVIAELLVDRARVTGAQGG